MQEKQTSQQPKNEENLQDLSAIRVITISQQYGGAGELLARRLARRLDWRYVDHEIIVQVARRMGVSIAEAEAHNLRLYSGLDRFLLSMQLTSVETVEAWASQSSLPILPQKQEHLYHSALQQAVEDVAATGQKVILGHGAQALLAGRSHVFHVQLVAPLMQRTALIMQRELVSKKEALARIQQRDRQVARYLRSQCQRDVNDPLLYDLTINSDTLDLESQVDLICYAYEQKNAASLAHAAQQISQFYTIIELPATNHLVPQDREHQRRVMGAYLRLR